MNSNKNGQTYEFSLLTDHDLYLFNEGSNYRVYEKMGAHPVSFGGTGGTYFAVWAPNAKQVSVTGSFNNWDKSSHQLHSRGRSGIWEGFIPGARKGDLYKFAVLSGYNDYRVEKADPFATYNEVPPAKASVVWNLEYDWNDRDWMDTRQQYNSFSAPVSIYEVHCGSWKHKDQRPLSYLELAPLLVQYVKEMGFTHVEFLPLMEHPFYGSWGYQTTGYFAPTARYGTPQGLMALIDHLHRNNIGVILDWVPSHFPNDEHGPGYFDGTHLFEHADPKLGIHPDWNSYIFNYSRNEVRSFLLSSALFWLDRYHVDGLRVDAVASMLYLDYSRKPGEWIPNKYGGRENLDAISFLRQLNKTVYREYPGVQTIAEESSAWPRVSRPVYMGGLGFGHKWDMGWMHDTLNYMSKDPIFRKYLHNNLTFRAMYAHSENYILPLSHDEVVYGKGSLLSRMPGDSWRKYANLRLLFGYMYTLPGKKLLFMGDEFAQQNEWDHESELDWQDVKNQFNAGISRWVRDINNCLQNQPALYELDFVNQGFEWIDCNDIDHSVISFLRRGKSSRETLLVVCNFTPETSHTYRTGAPYPGYWKEVLNSDAVEYGGSGQGNLGGIEASPLPLHGRPFSLTITLPPLGIVILKPEATS